MPPVLVEPLPKEEEDDEEDDEGEPARPREPDVHHPSHAEREAHSEQGEAPMKNL